MQEKGQRTHDNSCGLRGISKEFLKGLVDPVLVRKARIKRVGHGRPKPWRGQTIPIFIRRWPTECLWSIA